MQIWIILLTYSKCLNALHLNFQLVTHRMIFHSSFNFRLHTWGDTLKEAFEQCGMAMFAYMTEIDKVEPKQCFKIEANGDDLESLLFHFLDELLFLFSAEPYLICSKLEISNFDLVEFNIECLCYGEPFQLGKHPQGTEVKAITYSAMQIIQKPTRNDVYVIIDI